MSFFHFAIAEQNCESKVMQHMHNSHSCDSTIRVYLTWHRYCTGAIHHTIPYHTIHVPRRLYLLNAVDRRVGGLQVLELYINDTCVFYSQHYKVIYRYYCESFPPYLFVARAPEEGERQSLPLNNNNCFRCLLAIRLPELCLLTFGLPRCRVIQYYSTRAVDWNLESPSSVQMI